VIDLSERVEDDKEDEDGEETRTVVLPAQGAANKVGPCAGCGKANSAKRFVTKEYLCPDCRDDLRFKLITKSTINRLYPLLTQNDLAAALNDNQLTFFEVKNWHNYTAAPIKLFYEREIMALARRKERHTTARSRSRLDPSEHRHSRLRVEKVE